MQMRCLFLVSAGCFPSHFAYLCIGIFAGRLHTHPFCALGMAAVDACRSSGNADENRQRKKNNKSEQHMAGTVYPDWHFRWCPLARPPFVWPPLVSTALMFFLSFKVKLEPDECIHKWNKYFASLSGCGSVSGLRISIARIRSCVDQIHIGAPSSSWKYWFCIIFLHLFSITGLVRSEIDSVSVCHRSKLIYMDVYTLYCRRQSDEDSASGWLLLMRLPP